MTTLFTIGFTQKSAEQFFSALMDAGVRRMIDTRLNNRSQLAGFAKAADLSYFLRTIGNIDYAYAAELAPTQEMLDRYKKAKGSWVQYTEDYLGLLDQRRVSEHLGRWNLEGACLLCSEHDPRYCHRRLAAEYFQSCDPSIEIVHLGLTKGRKGE